MTVNTKSLFSHEKNERIIKFPLPDWNKPFVSNDDLDAYCVCYQYDVNEYGYGPYGFDTENSKKIIDKVFDDNLFYLSESGVEKISNVKLMKKKGFYVYSKLNSIVSLHCEIESYKKIILKNKIKKNKSLPLSPEPIKPSVLNLMKGDAFYSKDISRILDMGYGVFIINHYMPEAGESFIFFDTDAYRLFEKYAIDSGVGCLVVDSIDKLKSW